MAKYKGIAQNTDQVKAFLDGRRTRISLPVRPQPIDNTEVDGNFFHGNHKGYVKVDGHPDWQRQFAYQFAPHQIGDIVFVKEAITRSAMNDAIYLADGSFVFLNNEPRLYDSIDADYFSKTMKTIPSIHMPQEAARIWLKIVDVKVERLQQISEEDAVKEGVQFLDEEFGYSSYGKYRGMGPMKLSAIQAFASMNDKAWKENKWHFVYTVEIIDKP